MRAKRAKAIKRAVYSSAAKYNAEHPDLAVPQEVVRKRYRRAKRMWIRTPRRIP